MAEVEVQECPDPNCVDGITWHVESAHHPGCDGTEEGCQRECPIPVQVQDQCGWPGHRVD